MMKSFWFSIIVSIVFVTPALAYDWSTNPGDGSLQNPYQISEPNHLMSIVSNSAHYILMNDIVFDPNNNPNHVFTTSVISGNFSGTFNGNGHCVWNLRIDGGSELGLFERIIASGSIENLRLENVNITGSYRLGGLCAINGGTINNCHTSGSVTGTENVGGMIGESSGLVTNCFSAGIVESSVHATGGLIGYCWTSVYNSGSSASVTGRNCTGGLVGEHYSMEEILRCYATGPVVGTGTQNAGGLVGYEHTGTISDCYSTGSVTALSANAGGILGYLANPGEVTRCYATGIINGHYSFTNGIIGAGFPLFITGELIDAPYCYYLSTSSSGESGEPLTEEEMKQQASFETWDFVKESVNGENEIWRMCDDGVDYPRLSWEFAKNGDFACDNGVDLGDLQALAEEWLTAADTTPTTFNYACDANGDKQIDLFDYATLADNW